MKTAQKKLIKKSDSVLKSTNKEDKQRKNTSRPVQHPKTIGRHGTDDERTLNPEE
jgi:hypothetical protein